MQIGIITVEGRQVGVVTWSAGDADTFQPDLDGYSPAGRADRDVDGVEGGGAHHHHAGSRAAPEKPRMRFGGEGDTDPLPARSGGYQPTGKSYEGEGGRPVRQGSVEVDHAIVDAARAHHLDPNTMRSIASIESAMNPSSNANRSTQYKGLYQIGREEWRRFGQGNIYNARDNAMATGRMFEANRSAFRARYGRDPTDTELYLMHQQGLGFYTRGAMTNIGGNPYPGMRGAQSHDTFEAGWGREVARRKAMFAAQHPAPKPAPPPEPEIIDPANP